MPGDDLKNYTGNTVRIIANTHTIHIHTHNTVASSSAACGGTGPGDDLKNYTGNTVRIIDSLPSLGIELISFSLSEK